MWRDAFRWVSASTRGAHHREMGTPNQDHHRIVSSEDALILCVSDGCGGMPQSQVGSEAMTRIAPAVIQAYLEHHKTQPTFLFSTRDLLMIAQEIRAQLKAEAQARCENNQTPLLKVLQEMYLATVICAVILPQQTYVLHGGDGCVYLNGHDLSLPHVARLAPKFLVYGGLDLPQGYCPEDEYGLHLLHEINTHKLDQLLIATDGLHDFHHCSWLTGRVSQFWQNERFFEDEMSLQSRLEELASARLDDDTTLISLVRSPQETATSERVTLRPPHRS